MLGGIPTAFRPLRHRDFRLLWTGLAISLVGSGLWLVALAWQVIELGGGPTELSLVTALFSVGLLAFVLIGGAVGALAISSGRLPRRYLTVMILMWGLGSLPFAVIGVADALWVMCAALFVVGATYSAAMVIWGTLLQRRVPEGLRGRVSSLDFFVSLALMPVSMAIAGPAGAAFGITTVFVVAGIVPGFLALAAIVVPRLDRDELAHPLDLPEPAPVKGLSGSTQNEPRGGERL